METKSLLKLSIRRYSFLRWTIQYIFLNFSDIFSTRHTHRHVPTVTYEPLLFLRPVKISSILGVFSMRIAGTKKCLRCLGFLKKGKGPRRRSHRQPKRGWSLYDLVFKTPTPGRCTKLFGRSATTTWEYKLCDVWSTVQITTPDKKWHKLYKNF